MTQSVANPERTSNAPWTVFARRRIVTIASLCLLLGVAALAWIIWRPLADSERRLVGTWRSNTVVFSFHSDRTISAPRVAGVAAPPAGKWYIHDNKLYCPDSAIDESIQTLLGRQLDNYSVLTFIDDNTISVFTPINGGTCKWQRIPKS